jgi:hypothetical protein
MPLVTTAYPIYCDFWAMAKGERRGIVVKREGNTTFSRGVNLPAEPDTVIALLEARTEKEIRAICRNSAWMAKQPASYLTFLPKVAKQFLHAKDDPHYPSSDRLSSIDKKFWFLARALAGAIYGLSPRRAVNIIGPGQPGQIFEKLTPEYVVRFQPSSGRSRKLK